MSDSDMKYVAIEVDLKCKRLRVGSCVIWAGTIMVLAWTGHALIGIPAMVPSIWKWWHQWERSSGPTRAPQIPVQRHLTQLPCEI